MVLILWDTRGLQWLAQWDATPKGGANPQNQSWSRSRVATHPREAEIPSSRWSSSTAFPAALACVRFAYKSCRAKSCALAQEMQYNSCIKLQKHEKMCVKSSGEYVLAPCTHCPSSQPSGFLASFRFLAKSSHGSARWAKS